MYSGVNRSARLSALTLVLGATAAVIWGVPRLTPFSAPKAVPAETAISASAGGRQPVAAEKREATSYQMELPDAPASDRADEPVDDRMTHEMPASDRWADDKQRIDRQITFQTADVEQRVRTFEVDCQRGGATMRLMDVLRIMAREGSINGFETWLRVEGRGDDVRVYREFMKDGVEQLPSKVVMDLNRWDEIRLFGIHPDAIKIRCLLRDQRGL